MAVPRHSGAYFPREFAGAVADTIDCRGIYCLSRQIAHVIVRRTFPARFQRHSYDSDIFEAAAAAGLASDRTAMNSFGVKTFDLFEAALRCDNVDIIPADVSHFENGAWPLESLDTVARALSRRSPLALALGLAVGPHLWRRCGGVQ